jgi:methionyl-tRNA synthetase
VSFVVDDFMAKKFYITTPIYYVNARPHIGHAYTTIACDTIARRQRAMGFDTWFLTGTDEHGQKIQRAAEAAGKAPQQLTDEVSAQFRALWDQMGITYDDYIRTTSERHKVGVQELWRRIRDNGYIYKGSYTGQYCVFDEMYVEVGPGEPCPECHRPTETVKEENYFFKLSAFAEPLLQLYTSQPDFIRPETRRNEVIAFVRFGLRDLSVSRSTFSWGVPVPDDPKHVIYVWWDALANYVTALGFGSPDTSRYEKFWPANVHMIGKEIVRFHCVYWPAFLMAARLPLPKSIVAHGWLLFEESKMSKSRGNIVRAETILDVLGSDALRYFLLREVVFGQDGSFSFDALVHRYNSDLANGLGNLASRTLAMITRYFKGEVPYPSHAAAHTPEEDMVAALAKHTIAEFHELFEQYQFSRALELAWALVAGVDKYIVENEPWSLAEKSDENSRARLATVLYTSAEALRIVTALAHPVMPEATAKIWAQLGLGDIKKFSLADLRWGQLHLGTKLGKVEPVFPRADKSTVERMQMIEEQQRAPAAADETQLATAAQAGASEGTSHAPAPVNQSAAPATDGRITIDDFAKVELRVAQVKVAEKVKGADKLLRLEVDLGNEVRQIVAGIAEAYPPETLVGRKIVIIANLAPRKLRGLESNGMLLAASLEGGKPVLAGFLEDVPVGARLK